MTVSATSPHRAEYIDGLSAHADHAEITHGEPTASDAFRRRLADTFGWDARVPALDATVTLS